MKIYFVMINIFMLLLLIACGGGENKLVSGGETPDDYRGTLVNSKLVATKNATFLIPYSVKAYSIVYYTIGVNGNKLKASGLLAVPQKATGEKSPLLSYQHGTIFLNEQAPSISNSSIDGIMILAGKGYIISAPDYIGYGESAGQIHPYIHANSLASASIDMLKASKQLLQSKNAGTNNQLFLAGYSEGGYATLALQKALQESNNKEFIVTASAAGAGSYDLTETAKTFANKVINTRPAYMSFLFKAYDTIYALNKISAMYQSPYLNTINSFFDGKHSSKRINDNLTTTTEGLFKASFLEILRDAGDHILIEKLALNNIYDWKPTAPTRLYHSPNDEIVPYSNSQKALTAMKDNGATNITLGDCPLKTHTQCAVPYLFDTIDFFRAYVNDL